MLFRKRNQAPKDVDAPRPRAAKSGEGDDANHLDFLAEMIRAYGENAFSLGSRPAQEIAALFEAWARHLLVGLPAPKGDQLPDADEPPSDEPKNLPGLRRAFRAHRESEFEYVTRALGDFREATWAFISGLRRSLAADQASNDQLGHRMRRLESAVRAGEPGAIKNEAQETIGALTQFLSVRGESHQAQLTEMAARLQSLRDELDSVRAQAAIDGLTQVYNRAAFDEQIEREVDLATLLWSAGLSDLRRHRPFQMGQRHPRPPGRRHCPAANGGHAFSMLHA